MTITVNRRVALAGLAVVATAVAGGLAYAAIPGSDGVISACFDKRGRLRVIDVQAAESCKKTESLLAWNVQGPAGPPGPPGPSGANRDVGPIFLPVGEEQVLAEAGTLRVVARCRPVAGSSSQQGEIALRSENGSPAVGEFDRPDTAFRVELNVVDSGEERAFLFEPQEVTERHPQFERYELTLLGFRFPVTRQSPRINGEGYVEEGCIFGGWFTTDVS